MRRPRKQQDRCHMVWPEKSSNTWPKSHGFALSRTVSCKNSGFNHKVTKAQTINFYWCLSAFVVQKELRFNA